MVLESTSKAPHLHWDARPLPPSVPRHQHVGRPSKMVVEGVALVDLALHSIDLDRRREVSSMPVSSVTAGESAVSTPA